LSFEGAAAGVASHQDEDDGHDDPPEMLVLICGPSVDGDVDGEDQVENKQGDDGEVEERVVAAVIFQRLRSGHGRVLLIWHSIALWKQMGSSDFAGNCKSRFLRFAPE